jgi:uncharacterized protein
VKQFVAVLWLSLLTAGQCVAQSSMYYDDWALHIPCLTISDSPPVVGEYTAYRAYIRRHERGSADVYLGELSPTLYGDYCSGRFDVATRLYTDIVNVGDDSYFVTLRHVANRHFVIESVVPRGPATTSLWVARNGANTVYLAGTVHLLRSQDYPLPRAFNEAYAKATTLYFEVDFDEPLEAGPQLTPAEIHELMRDPQGRTLTQVLTPENYYALKWHMYVRNMPIDVVEHWSVSAVLNLLRSWELNLYGFKYSIGVDEHYAQRAIQDFKSIHGLETTEVHDAVLLPMKEGQENAAVEHLLKITSASMRRDLIDMAEGWRVGDTSRIYLESIIPMRENAYEDYLRINANRNRAWLPTIEGLLQTPETEMIVVGVAHMAGDEGLVALLRERGYSVEKY